MSGPYGYQPMPAPQHQPVGQSQQDRPRPATVAWACRLLVVNVLLGVVTTIIAVSERDEIRKKIEQHDATLDTHEVETLYNAFLTVAVIIGLGLGLFYLFLAWKMWRGRNWARITTWVFTGLGALGLITSFVQPNVTIGKVSGVIGGLIDVAIIILLALRPSNDFFRKPPVPYGYYPSPPPQVR
jgi:drug/metabolite transporter (DMT)-like permease